MKMTVDHGVLTRALKRGGSAAFTSEGQSEEMRISDPTRGSVRITATKDKVVFESTVSKMAAWHAVNTSDSLLVEQEGSVCIPVKALKNVCDKIPSSCKMVVEFVPLPDENTKKEKSVIVKSNGEIVIQAFGQGKRKPFVKHRIDVFPSDEFESVKFSTEPVIIRGKAEALRNPYNTVLFAVNPTDAQELYNNVGVAGGKDVMYFVGTDSRRCAVVSVPKSNFEIADCSSPVLFEASAFGSILDMFGEETISVVEDADGMHVTLTSPETIVRMATVGKDLRRKYPDFKKIMEMPVNVSVVMDRKELEVALENVSIVNKDRSRYTFKLNGDSITVMGKGVSANKAVEAWVSCDPIPKALQEETICLSTNFFISSIKKLSGEKIRLSFTPDEKRARVESSEDPEFTYLMQRMYDDDQSN